MGKVLSGQLSCPCDRPSCLSGFSALQAFISGCIRFILHVFKYNRIDYRFHNSLNFCCALHPKNYFYHFQGLFMIIKEIFFKIPGQFKDKLHFFRIPGVFQDQGHFPGLFKVCANRWKLFGQLRKEFAPIPKVTGET